MSWYKVTHLSNFPGESLISNWPRKRPAARVHPGRWIVFDKAVHPNPALPAHAVSDHRTFEEASAECSRLYHLERAAGEA